MPCYSSVLHLPDGTVPLYSWWNADRGDNFATSDSRWAINPDGIVWCGEYLCAESQQEQSDYTLYRLEGYLHSN